MTSSLEALVLEAAAEAGAVIRDVYSRPIAFDAKADGSPVTEADAAAERVIARRLAATGLPMLAEEAASAGVVPDLGRRYFCVDPLDGTREFLKRNGEFTVNIALVEDGYPVLGVVLVPVTGITYVGGPDGAVRIGADGTRTRLSVGSAVPPRIVASRSHGHAAIGELCARMGLGENVSVGSSLKFCLLAEGKAEIYPRVSPTSHWDTAAGQAVLEAAGGVMVDLSGARFSYPLDRGHFLNPGFVAAVSPALAEAAVGALTEIMPR